MVRRLLVSIVTGLACFPVAAADLTPCEAYGGADAVFIGEASAPVWKQIATGDPDHPVDRMKFVPIVVDQIIRGAVAPTVYMTPAGIEVYPEVGKRYLIYGRTYSAGADMFFFSAYYGSKPIERADEDLRFLSGISTTTGGNVISGVVQETQSTSGAPRHIPLSNVSVRLSNGTFSVDVRTDGQGSFVASGIPDGIYKVHAEVPDDLMASDGEVRVTGGGCATARPVWARANGHVRGTLRGPDGKPLIGLSVQLVPFGIPLGPTDRPNGEGLHGGGASTDVVGRFDIAGIEPGTYWLGFNLNFGPRLFGGEYARTYYPGTPDEAAAIPITVQRGGVVEGLDFSLGPKLREGSVSVSVDPQGHAGTLSMCFENLDDRIKGWTTHPVSAGQMIALPVLEGVHYEVHAHLEFPGGHLESAPVEFTGSADNPQSIRLIVDAPRTIHR